MSELQSILDKLENLKDEFIEELENLFGDNHAVVDNAKTHLGHTVNTARLNLSENDDGDVVVRDSSQTSVPPLSSAQHLVGPGVSGSTADHTIAGGAEANDVDENVPASASIAQPSAVNTAPASAADVASTIVGPAETQPAASTVETPASTVTAVTPTSAAGDPIVTDPETGAVTNATTSQPATEDEKAEAGITSTSETTQQGQ